MLRPAPSSPRSVFALGSRQYRTSSETAATVMPRPCPRVHASRPGRSCAARLATSAMLRGDTPAVDSPASEQAERGGSATLLLCDSVMGMGVVRMSPSHASHSAERSRGAAAPSSKTGTSATPHTPARVGRGAVAAQLREGTQPRPKTSLRRKSRRRAGVRARGAPGWARRKAARSHLP
jgi:hypothetical protein